MSQIKNLSLGSISFLVHRRTSLFTAFILIACFVVWLISLLTGDFPMSFNQIIAVLSGGGTPLERTVIIQWRLARALVAVTIGAALGISGAITQRIARNGLASPDILGISRGATCAAVALMVFNGGASSAITTYVGIPLAAVIGGLFTAAVIWLLSVRSGLDMFRLVLVGIGVNAALQAVITYMLAATDLNTAAAAKVWMIGTINGRTFEHLWPTLIALIIALIVLIRISIHLPILELGTDASLGLGVPLKRVNTLLLIISVALAAITVSAVGPVGFVAFVAPQIAARLAQVGAPPITLSAAMGGFLLISSDLLARSLFPWEVPVGIVTSALGGPFLIWLLLRQSKIHSR
ncbi:iron ABC transporter permease [Corynebacterium kutscheri]|uniref:ABC-type enterobactin transport system, permease component n=1 Tax=Corynebacterium kutscheri TaxID=35755 RepID=A0A0F6TCU2_9CORY|nr:iron chelate uptake ABC transporter family permease subunit [Corynebacterium kutscheri]AKE41044.1 ABC-type enterobactin transport system, permease component [Corynebacterium kutscheri]VEH06933.1 iron ABC transporter permease [Corynebacterium kutscheri]VEH09342.1 iron ABC transporter permease [Corynebacterium kutscheri]VEH79429.1 iron ABC transporter permease [Corynebacterium kutscheri]